MLYNKLTHTEFDMLVDFIPQTQANSFPDQCIDILNQPQDEGPF